MIQLPVPQTDADRIHILYDNGYSIEQICEMVDCHSSYVKLVLDENL